MPATRPARRVRRAALIASLAAAPLAGSALDAQEGAPGDSLRRIEGAYAARITAVADDAIHRLDFFSARTQMRVQVALADPRALAQVPFGAIGELAARAAESLDEAQEHFGELAAPEDLMTHHRALVVALRESGIAAAHLASAAAACDADRASTPRCAGPISAASSELLRAYRKYVDVRRRIAEQVTDTGTRLIAFTAPR